MAASLATSSITDSWYEVLFRYLLNGRPKNGQKCTFWIWKGPISTQKWKTIWVCFFNFCRRVINTEITVKKTQKCPPKSSGKMSKMPIWTQNWKIIVFSSTFKIERSFQRYWDKTSWKWRGEWKLTPLENTQKMKTPLSPNRILPNFGIRLVLMHSFMETFHWKEGVNGSFRGVNTYFKARGVEDRWRNCVF